MSQNISLWTFHLLRKSRANWWNWLSSKIEPGSRKSNHCATNSGVRHLPKLQVCFVLYNGLSRQLIQSTSQLRGTRMYWLNFGRPNRLLNISPLQMRHNISLLWYCGKYWCRTIMTLRKNHIVNKAYLHEGASWIQAFFTDRCRRIFYRDHFICLEDPGQTGDTH